MRMDRLQFTETPLSPPDPCPIRSFSQLEFLNPTITPVHGATE